MRSRRGFTLIELLVVIDIIAILNRPLAAGRAEGPRGRQPNEVPEQTQADRACQRNYESTYQRFPSGLNVVVGTTGSDLYPTDPPRREMLVREPRA
jgi:prepilin-type N-terminal cleavage/methylation domain-containing protein